MNKLKNILLISIFALFYSLPIKSQYISNGSEPKSDSIKCLENISVYKEFQKLDFYDKAIPAWEKTYKSCKGFKKIIYQDGVKFMVYLIQKEKDDNKREKLVDSLMHVYDERIQYFGQEAYVWGRQGIDLLRYSKNRIEEAHALLSKSFEAGKDETEDAVIVSFMTTAEILFTKNKLSKEDVADAYLKCIATLENKLKDEKDTKKIKNIKSSIEVVDDIFGKSKAADCESLVAVFADKFETKKEDVEQVLKIQSILRGAGCIDEDLFLNVSLQAQKLQPTAANAALIGGLYLKKEKYNESINFLQEAVEKENVDTLKANYLLDIGIIYCNKLKQYQQARNIAYEAIKLRPNWGKPYILIGDAYANSSATFGGNQFENATVYWAAVDKYYKAKSIDPESDKIATQKINYYANYFPGKEDTFMQGYSDGAAYKVGGWINENTTVRVKK